ncbi:MAG: YebC/PmpR family DNA-binding transcriptional regulator [Chloroflexi bacterium]|nr:YebC/PmpR family DNA-binding transcriptional regulator [Chloroflexota bacterium]
MSGHSKWSSIKHKKAATDAKRGKLFTKLARDVTMAARSGDDPDMNPALRLAIQKARDSNMPRANIDRAVQRAVGGGDGAMLEEITYEGYAPGGTAVLIQAITDNRNRTVADIRATLTRGGGAMAESGAVAWQFDLRGLIAVEVGDDDPDEIQLVAIEAGADDVSADADIVEVITDPGDLEAVRAALTEAGCEVNSSEIAQIPKTRITPADNVAGQALRLLDALDELDDVSRVYSNVDFSDEVLAAGGLAG